MAFWVRLPLLLLFLLAGCSWNEPAMIDLPDEIEAVSSPFVIAMQKGSREAAAKHVSPNAQDELAAHFGTEQGYLKKYPQLTPRFITYKPERMMGPEDSEVTIVYAARKSGDWAMIEVRLFRLRDEPYEVDYWKIRNQAPVAKSYGPNMRPAFRVFAAIAAVLVIGGALAIGIVIWLVRRKPHIIVPEAPTERRSAAITTRDSED
jgi:hypothetical protein